MKRLWTFLVLALGVGIASMPETGWTQVSSDTISATFFGPADSVTVTGWAISGDTIFASTGNFVYRSTDNGNTWQHLRVERWDSVVVFGIVFGITVVDSGHLLAGTSEFIFKSTDNGESWRAVNLPERVRAKNFLRFADGTIITPSFYGGVWKSTDNGNSWVKRTAGIDTVLAWQSIVRTPSGTLFICSGHADGGWGVYRSTDNGESWRAANNGLDNGLPGAYSSLNIWRLAAPQTGSSRTVIAATTYAGIYRTDDEGENWYRLENIPVNWGGAVTICTLGSFVGDRAYGRLYRSSDGGSTWDSIFQQPQHWNTAIWSLAQYGSDLLVGTTRGGYRLSFIVTGVEDEPAVPTAFQLQQNYPNPFNPTTTIEFSIPERALVNLTVYNLLGQAIETLVSEEKEVGTYRIPWSAGNKPSGVYIYRLETPKFQSVKKMLLVK